MRIFTSFGDWLRSGMHDAWCWVQGLDLQGWLMFLAITSAAGFMCMRGFGSRNSY